MATRAPVVLFIYKRADHLYSTLTSLKRCNGFDGAPVIVFGDGPKTQGDSSAVAAARRVAQEQLGQLAEYRFSEKNRGLSASIIGGVEEVTTRYGRAIVVEDDLELSPSFLTYMNAALDKYENKQRVYQISGHTFSTPEFLNRDSAMFLPFTTSWGWATWRRAWDQFDPSAQGWEILRSDQMLRKRFNLDGHYDYATMLERQMSGRGDSWGIRWYWSVFRNDGLACFPPASLVRNTGMDGSGTHGRGLIRRFGRAGHTHSSDFIDLPSLIAVDDRDFAAVRYAIWAQNGGWIGALADRLRHRLNVALGKHK
jgi:hypothetical protein